MTDQQQATEQAKHTPGNTFYVRANDESGRWDLLDSADTWVCEFESESFAEQVATSLNTHDALVEALEGLFEHCAMVHRHWGYGSNAKEAAAAIADARATLAAAKRR